MSKREENRSSLDIFQLLKETAERRRRERRKQFLESMGVEEYFEEGGIGIDLRTCRGVDCKLCIDVCPTHALYWGSGELGIEEDLCVYCTACVLSCIVDDCIRVWRRRPNGEVEEFSTPRQVFILLDMIDARKRRDRVESRLEWTRKFASERDTLLLPAYLELRKRQKEF